MRLMPNVRLSSHGILAALAIVATVVAEPAINRAVRGLLGVGPAVTTTADGKAFVLLPFTVFLIIRTGWYLAGFAVVRRLLKRGGIRQSRPSTYPRWLANGLATGIAVMAAVILAIAAVGGGDIAYLQSHTARAFALAMGWLGCSLAGAAAEEVLYRGMILMTLDRLAGRPLAIIGSALAFALSHVGNPGASELWLLRLFVQGLLLAWALTRTGSLGWPIGYHAGWNFASAPLFGAAGSGYGANGHFFSFVATGPAWLTGGEVGPEGSVLAFVAMAAAAAVLVTSSRRPFVAPAGQVSTTSNDACRLPVRSDDSAGPVPR